MKLIHNGLPHASLLPRKMKTVILITDFKDTKNQSNPWPMSNIQEYLDSIRLFQFATFIYLNMGYYAIMLDEDIQK